MGRHAEQPPADGLQSEQSYERPWRLPIYRKAMATLIATLVFFLYSFLILLIPLQQANQSLAHGSVKMATVDSSRIIRAKPDLQRISYHFENGSGKVIYGEVSRDKPDSQNEIDSWGAGRNINVHYLSDTTYIVGDVIPNSLTLMSIVFSLVLSLLLVALGTSLTEVRARSDDEWKILNPRPEATVIQFNEKTNRSELSERSSGVLVESYRSLAAAPRGFIFSFFFILFFVFGVISAALFLSVLTMANPSPDSVVVDLAGSFIVSSTLCFLTGALSHRFYLSEIGQEKEAEILRRRQLIEDHRKNVAQ